jgi:hypothetical protein
MRKKIPERTINRISNTIKALRRNRPVSGNSTGRNLSLDMLYSPGTQALNNKLFKNHISKFIRVSKDLNPKNIRDEDYTLAIWSDYYEESDT